MARQFVPIGPVVGALTYKQKPIKLFKPYKFDSSDAIIGIDMSDSANGRYEKYSFIIDRSADLEQLKKDWVFTDPADLQSDKGVFKVYFTKNKVIKKSWAILPERFGIITDDGYYLFDPSLLSKLHSKSPLKYSVHTDTLRSKNDYLRFNDSVKANPSFLFLIEPDLLYEGSFEVSVKAGSRISPENVGERIIGTCDKIKPKTYFRVYLKEGSNSGNSKYSNYIVRCSQLLFEQFSNPDLEKGSWIPPLYVIRSFWRQ